VSSGEGCLDIGLVVITLFAKGVSISPNMVVSLRFLIYSLKTNVEGHWLRVVSWVKSLLVVIVSFSLDFQRTSLPVPQLSCLFLNSVLFSM